MERGGGRGRLRRGDPTCTRRSPRSGRSATLAFVSIRRPGRTVTPAAAKPTVIMWSRPGRSAPCILQSVCQGDPSSSKSISKALARDRRRRSLQRVGERVLEVSVGRESLDVVSAERTWNDSTGAVRPGGPMPWGRRAPAPRAHRRPRRGARAGDGRHLDARLVGSGGDATARTLPSRGRVPGVRRAGRCPPRRVPRGRRGARHHPGDRAR